MQIVGVLRTLDEFQLVGGEADFVEMIGGRPCPDDVAVRIDLIGHVVEHLRRGESRQRIGDVGEDKRIAIGQARDVVMLPRESARRAGAEIPDLLAVPIHFADCLDDTGLRAARNEIGPLAFLGFERDEDMPLRASSQGGVEIGDGLAAKFPFVDDLAVQIDKARNIVAAGKEDE